MRKLYLLLLFLVTAPALAQFEQLLDSQIDGSQEEDEINALNLINGPAEADATADQTDSEIATAYGNEVPQVSGAEITAGTETAIRRFSPEDVANMAATHGGGGGGGGSSALDLGDDDVNESSGITEIATTGDTNNIATEPAANKLLLDMGQNWPTSDTAAALSANGTNCSAGSYTRGVDASGNAEDCTVDDDVPESGDFGNAAALEANGALSPDSVTTTNIVNDAVGGAQIAPNAVGSSEINTAAVGSDEIATDAVGSAEIATDAVGSDEIATDAVGSLEIAADAVGSSEIATGAVEAAEIATDAVNADEIAAGAVGSSELASTAVVAGSYTNLNATIDADGRITNASNGVDNGATQLSELSDVNTSTPTNRNVLVGDGVDWESRALAGEDIQSGTVAEARIDALIARDSELSTECATAGCSLNSATTHDGNTIVTTAATQTLTNKTITSSTLNISTTGGLTEGDLTRNGDQLRLRTASASFAEFFPGPIPDDCEATTCNFFGSAAVGGSAIVVEDGSSSLGNYQTQIEGFLDIANIGGILDLETQTQGELPDNQVNDNLTSINHIEIVGETLADIGTPADTDRVMIQDVSDATTAKYVLYSTITAGGAGGFDSWQVFTSSGTWTKPAGVNKVLVCVQGAGGGGGGGNGSGAGDGGGGAAGGYVCSVLDVTSISSSTITVGAGGTGGATATDGSDGGNSSWADGTNTLTGGGGGHGNEYAGPDSQAVGGTATGGDLNIPGQYGEFPAGTASGNHGGSSPLGFGGVSMTTSVLGDDPGGDGQGYGSGGAGGAGDGTSAQEAGGDGADGIVIVYEYKSVTEDNTEKYVVFLGAHDTDLTTGEKVVMPMSDVFEITDVELSCETAPTGSQLIVDIHEGATTIMSTDKLDIDAGGQHSDNAATQPDVTDTSIAANAFLSFEVDQIGSTVAGNNCAVTITGYH